MTCEGFERDLALYVEGDLPVEDAALLERHLRDCAGCRAFLQSLQESQHWLKSMAADPLAEDEVGTVWHRVLAASVLAPATGRSPRMVPTGRVYGFVAVAAALAFLIVGTWVHRSSRRGPVPAQPPVADATGALWPEERQREQAAPSPGTPSAAPGAAGLAQGASGAPTPTVAHPRSARTRAERASAPAGASLPASLTPDEADQLARAVVLISRIDRVPERLGERADGGESLGVGGAPSSSGSPGSGERPDAGEPGSDAAFVKLFTADPDVVIYWQVGQNGG